MLLNILPELSTVKLLMSAKTFPYSTFTPMLCIRPALQPKLLHLLSICWTASYRHISFRSDLYLYKNCIWTFARKRPGMFSLALNTVQMESRKEESCSFVEFKSQCLSCPESMSDSNPSSMTLLYPISGSLLYFFQESEQEFLNFLNRFKNEIYFKPGHGQQKPFWSAFLRESIYSSA